MDIFKLVRFNTSIYSSFLCTPVKETKKMFDDEHFKRVCNMVSMAIYVNNDYISIHFHINIYSKIRSYLSLPADVCLSDGNVSSFLRVDTRNYTSTKLRDTIESILRSIWFFTSSIKEDKYSDLNECPQAYNLVFHRARDFGGEPFYYINTFCLNESVIAAIDVLAINCKYTAVINWAEIAIPEYFAFRVASSISNRYFIYDLKDVPEGMVRSVLDDIREASSNRKGNFVHRKY